MIDPVGQEPRQPGTHDAPTHDAPTYHPPVTDAPAYHQPIYDAPAYDPPAQDAAQRGSSDADPASPPGGGPIGPRHHTGGQRILRRRRGSGNGPAAAPVSAGRAAVGAATEVVVVLGMALVLSLLIKTFLVQAFYIPSESMATTLLVGDRVLVSKLTPGPFSLHHGDVVVFKDPGGWLGAAPAQDDGAFKKAVRETLTFVGLLPQDSGEHLIKRVIGLPGDTVTCCNDKGQMSVNGVPLDETPYLYAGDAPNSGKSPFSVTVPTGKLWVMGDHRSVSEDSRAHRELNGGFVPIDDVVGKAFVVVWPFDRASGLGVPDTVFARVPDAATS